MKMFFFPLLFFTFSTYADCWHFASQRFGIEVRLLQSIAEVESGMNPYALGKNNNGTQDFGLMQINSSHLTRLRKKGIDQVMLQSDPCVSILVGASILQDMVRVYGYGWEAVGAYNAGVGKLQHQLRMKYAKRVWHIYRMKPSNQLILPVTDSHRRIALLD